MLHEALRRKGTTVPGSLPILDLYHSYCIVNCILIGTGQCHLARTAKRLTVFPPPSRLSRHPCGDIPPGPPLPNACSTALATQIPRYCVMLNGHGCLVIVPAFEKTSNIIAQIRTYVHYPVDDHVNVWSLIILKQFRKPLTMAQCTTVGNIRFGLAKRFSATDIYQSSSRISHEDRGWKLVR